MTGKGKPLKILVLSDLHFCKSSAEEHSWLVHDSSSEIPIWEQMLETIKKDSIDPTLILCPGDITTRACGDSLKVAWEKLNDLRKIFPYSVLAVATGNHDVESRSSSPKNNALQEMEKYCDLTQNLKLLNPPYPLIPGDAETSFCAKSNRIHYFGTDFVIYDEDPSYRLVILNSCSRHRDDPKEFNRGSIGEASLQWLEEELKATDNQNGKLNILLCHHHPIRHDDYGLGQYDQMYDGEKLIKLLNMHGHWMIIHGHKHHARLVYSGGGTKKTPIFSAGTFSAHKNTLGNEFHNQFYLLSIEPSSKRALRGTVEVWNWSQNDGWKLGVDMAQKVFTGVGFGYSGDLEDLADEIASQLNVLEEKSWDELSNTIDNLKFLVPSDYDHLKQSLEALQIEIDLNRDGSLAKLRKAI